MTGPRPRPGDGLLHPVPLTAIALLLVNDHLLKTAWPGAFTGKLSDVAGLVLFPLVLVAAWELTRASLGRPATAGLGASVVAVVSTGVVFSLVKLDPTGADLYRVALGMMQWPFAAAMAMLTAQPIPALGRAVSLVADPSDLVALPALVLPLAVSIARIPRPGGSAARICRPVMRRRRLLRYATDAATPSLRRSCRYRSSMHSPGPFPDVVEIVVEIPRHSRNKYEFDEDAGVFRLDRVLSSAVYYNFDYGFIEGTRAGDGDHTDALLIIDEPTFTGCHVWARPIGGLEMRDEKGFDFKVLCVAIGDAHQQHIERLEQVRPHRLVEIEHFFQTYKALEDKTVDVLGWRDRDRALDVLRTDRTAWERETGDRPE